MTEHVYEYPLDDFEPSKACMQHAITNGTCCPSGTHRHDCEIVQGYNKERLAKYDADRPFTLTDFFLTVFAVSFTAFAVLWTINGGFQP